MAVHIRLNTFLLIALHMSRVLHPSFFSQVHTVNTHVLSIGASLYIHFKYITNTANVLCTLENGETYLECKMSKKKSWFFPQHFSMFDDLSIEAHRTGSYAELRKIIKCGKRGRKALFELPLIHPFGLILKTFKELKIPCSSTLPKECFCFLK